MSDLILRAGDKFDISGDGRTIEGIAFPWDVPASVQDPGITFRYQESFDRRSVTNTLRTRGDVRPMFVRHAYVRGSFGEVKFRPSAEGLIYTARAFADSQLAAEVLADGLGEHGRYPAVSVGFYPITPKGRPGPGQLVHRTEIRLEELSVAEVGQHPGAKVLAVRAEDGTPRLEALRRRLATLPNW